MASPAGQFHPWRLIITFLVITAGLYALVLFTPGSTTPKLGIDLQGGTRITMQAETINGKTPSNDSMKQARSIMERRVNGSGVSGAQVQVSGSNQLVVTVPGENNLTGLTRSARLNIRPMVTRWINPALASQVTPSTAPGSGSASTGVTPSVQPSGAASSGAPSAGMTSSPGATSSAAQGSQGAGSSAANSAAITADSAQGLRAPGAALAPAADGDAPTSDAPSSVAASTAGSAAQTPSAAETTSPAASSAASNTSTASTGAAGTSGTVSDSAEEPPPLSAFPDGSSSKVPTQPKGDDAAAFKAWETAASTAAKSGSGPTCKQIEYYQGLDNPKKPLLACDEANQYIYLLDKTLIPGQQIKDASSQFDTQGGHGWIINVTFDKKGFNTWSNYTKKHWDQTGGSNPPPASFTAFTLDGEVLSAPVINEPITTPGTMVSGNFTQESAKALANSLKFGALPLAFERLATKQVSGELGLQYLKAGLIAGGIGLALVIVYCLVYYRLLGLITILSLLLSGGLIYAVMVLLGRWIGLSLDMAGIAGLIIAIGITADSFIVYFERIKDEVREGRTFRSSVPRGWTRAKKTILSADAVSFLSAAILYILAVGDVKGFAFTLGLSTVLDLVVVFLVTHPLVALLSKANIFAHPIWSGLGSVAKAGQEHRAAAARLQAKEA